MLHTCINQCLFHRFRCSIPHHGHDAYMNAIMYSVLCVEAGKRICFLANKGDLDKALQCLHPQDLDNKHPESEETMYDLFLYYHIKRKDAEKKIGLMISYVNNTRGIIN